MGKTHMRPVIDKRDRRQARKAKRGEDRGREIDERQVYEQHGYGLGCLSDLSPIDIEWLKEK